MGGGDAQPVQLVADRQVASRRVGKKADPLAGGAQPVQALHRPGIGIHAVMAHAPEVQDGPLRQVRATVRRETAHHDLGRGHR